MHKLQLFTKYFKKKGKRGNTKLSLKEVQNMDAKTKLLNKIIGTVYILILQ